MSIPACTLPAPTTPTAGVACVSTVPSKRALALHAKSLTNLARSVSAMAQNTIATKPVASPTAAPSDAALNQGKLGTLSVAFMIIAASAPLTVLAGGTPTNYAVSGLECTAASSRSV